MENEKTQKRRVRTTSIITLLLCMIDIYIIINIPEDYIVLAAAVFVTLISAALTLNSWFKWTDMQEQHRNEHYSDIMNVQKSSYVILQKKVQDLDEKLNFIGQKIMPLEKAGDVNQKKIASMLDSIVEDQKKIAKITISRSKENADALMNSNDKLLLQMDEFRSSISGMQEELLSRQGKIRDEEAEKLDKSTDEIFGRITELKELLEKEAGEISENILTSKQSLEESYSNAIGAASESKHTSSGKETEEIKSVNLQVEADKTEQQSVSEQPVQEVIEISEQASETEEQPIPEAVEIPEQETEEQPIPEVMEVPEQASETEEQPIPEAVEIPEQEIEEQPIPEAMEVPEQASETEEQPLPEIVTESGQPMPKATVMPEQASVATEQPMPEIAAAPEQTVKNPSSDSSKPESDGPMSPEDIAALIAKTESEDLPEITEKYEEEEKPPMPDMSDPNRPMSPEDIAALIANM